MSQNEREAIKKIGAEQTKPLGYPYKGQNESTVWVGLGWIAFAFLLFYLAVCLIVGIAVTTPIAWDYLRRMF